MLRLPVKKIVNVDFSAAPLGWNGQSRIIVSGLPGGWSGTDIERSQQSNYISGGGKGGRRVSR